MLHFLEYVLASFEHDFRLSDLDMVAKRLMPVHIQQHLQALDRVASMEAQYMRHWCLCLYAFWIAVIIDVSNLLYIKWYFPMDNLLQCIKY